MQNINDTNLIFSGNPEYINVFNDEQSSSIDSIVLGACNRDKVVCSAPSVGCSLDTGTDVSLNCPPVLTPCTVDGVCGFDGTCTGADCSDFCFQDCTSDCSSDCNDKVQPGDCTIGPTGLSSDICADGWTCTKDEICMDGQLETFIYYAVGLKFQISGYTSSTTTDVHRTTGGASFTFNRWISAQPCYAFANGTTYSLTKHSDGVYYFTTNDTSTTPDSFITTPAYGTTGYTCEVTVNVSGYNALTITANTFFYANESASFQSPNLITAATPYMSAQVQMRNMKILIDGTNRPSPIKFEISTSNGTKYYAYSLHTGPGPITNPVSIDIFSSSYTGSIYVRSVGIGVGGTTYGYTIPTTKQTITFNNGVEMPLSSSCYPVVDENNPVIATFGLLQQIYPKLNSSSSQCVSFTTYGSLPQLVLSGSVTSNAQQWRLTDVLRPQSVQALSKLIETSSINKKIII